MPHLQLQGARLYIEGRPALIQAGALHYFRLPHPDLWTPALQRMRMAGLNAVWLPLPWAYHSPAPGFYDFTGPRDLPGLLDAIQAAGLWLIPHLGPQVGADLDAGGLPGWLLPRLQADAALEAQPALWSPLREWWGQLFAHLGARENLLLSLVTDAEAEALPKWLALARSLAGATPVLPAANFAPYLGAAWREGAFPWAELTAWAEAESAPGAICRSAPLPVWGGPDPDKTAAALGDEHPRLVVGALLAHGAQGYALTPFTAGATWGYWGTSEARAVHGVGAPLGPGLALSPRYYELRRLALTAETLGRVLAAASAAQHVYPSDARYLCGARTDGATTVVFLHSRNLPAEEVAVSVPAGDEMVATAPFFLLDEALRVLPLNWPLAGGLLRSTTLEPVLYTVVAGRALLIVTNEEGGALSLSADFRPRHARGAVQASREEGGLRVTFEAGRLSSLLLDGPEGPLQLLALEPHLASRVWPLDDAWRTTPSYPPAWSPDPEEPARGLIIGPELVLPDATGGYEFWVREAGLGYRWGPWRGSDPHTWLSPLSWPSPPSLPEAIWQPWETRPGAPELSDLVAAWDWQRIPAGDSLAMEAQGLHTGYAWYRGEFTGPATMVTVTCRDACDLFLNGEHIAALETPVIAAEPAPKRIPLPQRLLREENLLLALVECQGHTEAWPEALRSHGLLSCTVDSGAPLRWAVRGGLTGEYQVQGMRGFAAWSRLPEQGATHVQWHRGCFMLATPPDVEAVYALQLSQMPAKALLFLNGCLIGRTWEARGPQDRFWLPQGLLDPQGENELLIAQWTRGGSPMLGQVQVACVAVYRRVQRR